MIQLTFNIWGILRSPISKMGLIFFKSKSRMGKSARLNTPVSVYLIPLNAYSKLEVVVGKRYFLELVFNTLLC